MDKRERATLRYKLSKICTDDTANDKEFFERLKYTLLWVTDEINRFEESYINNIVNDEDFFERLKKFILYWAPEVVDDKDFFEKLKKFILYWV